MESLKERNPKVYSMVQRFIAGRVGPEKRAQIYKELAQLEKK